VTTFTDFTPTATQPFQFSPTLDGAPYSLVVTWGLAGQRWYVNLYDQHGVLIFYLPLIASPSAMATQSLTWDSTQHIVTVITTVPHALKIGVPVTLTIANVVPLAYNGIVTLLPIGPSTLTYSQTTDPGGDATTQGTIGRDINLGAGYFQTSTLVFRDETQQFEVNP
jgi:hypothetical protein